MTTLVTDAQVAEVRRTTAEPDPAGTYTDALIVSFIERYPHLDEFEEIGRASCRERV